MSKKQQSQHKERPAVSYWDDPVYHYLSRQVQLALESGEETAEEYNQHLQDLVNQSLPDATYWQLDEEARSDKKKRKQERKQNQRHKRPPSKDSTPEGGINVAELKKRIFNPQVSRENVIKALEAMPSKERKATIAGLPPWLKRKLGQYIK